MAHPVSTSPGASRAEGAYRTLRGLIVSGALAPGAPLIERDLARRLGVSRTPLRIALNRLASEQYIAVSPIGRYTRAAVAPLTITDMRELFFLLGAVEGLSARFSAESPQEPRTELVQRLREENTRLLALASASPPDPVSVNDCDVQFHRWYVEFGGGPRLVAMHDAIKPQVARYELVYTHTLLGEIGTSVEEHRFIIDAIDRGDPDGAQTAVELNWRNASERLARVIRLIGEKGTW